MKINKREFTEFILKHPGLKYREIAKHFGCSYQYAQSYSVIHGLRERTRTYLKIDDDDLMEYVSEHPEKNVDDVAEYFGTTKRAVIGRAKKLGIKHLLPKTHHVDDDALREYALAHPNIFVADIAEHFGFSDGVISKALIRMGLRTPQRKIIDDKKLKELLDAQPKLRVKDIAKIFGCSTFAISKAKQRLRRKTGKKPPKPPARVGWEAYERILAVEPDISVRELAERVGVGASVANRMLRKHHLLRGHKRKFSRSEFIRLLREGESVKAIAEKFCVSETAIWNQFTIYGIKLTDIKKNPELLDVLEERIIGKGGTE